MHRNRSDFWRFAIAMPIADPRNRCDFGRQDKAMLHCDLRVRWKIASDLRFRAAISEPKTHSFCGGFSMRKSLAIAIVRFWCAKSDSLRQHRKHSATVSTGVSRWGG